MSKINLAATHLGEHKGELIGHRRQIPFLLRDLCRVGGGEPSVPCLSFSSCVKGEGGRAEITLPLPVPAGKWKQSKN